MCLQAEVFPSLLNRQLCFTFKLLMQYTYIYPVSMHKKSAIHCIYIMHYAFCRAYKIILCLYTNRNIFMASCTLLPLST